MGAGKSTLGPELARRLGRAFVSVDTLVEERTGLSVAELFAERGEQAFRALEEELACETLGRRPPAVVELGGGAHPPGTSGTYRDVLHHRAFMTVIGLNALFIFAGFSGFELLPVYAKNEAGVSETQIGLVFFVNTLVIVLAQLPTTRLAQGRRRMPVLGLLGALWATAWLIVPFAGGQAPKEATLLLVAAMIVFALGQCLHGAVQAPLVVDLAEPRLLGRYMALSALSWQVGFALGPAVGGYMLAVSPSGVWVAAAGLCALGGLLALLVEGTLPLAARRTPLASPT